MWPLPDEASKKRFSTRARFDRTIPLKHRCRAVAAVSKQRPVFAPVHCARARAMLTLYCCGALRARAREFSQDFSVRLWKMKRFETEERNINNSTAAQASDGTKSTKKTHARCGVLKTIERRQEFASSCCYRARHCAHRRQSSVAEVHRRTASRRSSRRELCGRSGRRHRRGRTRAA